MRYAKPIFNKKYEFIALKDFSLSAGTLVKLGSGMAQYNLQTHHLRSLYNRALIGVKDHPWTAARLQLPRSIKPEVSVKQPLKPVPVNDGTGWSILGVPTDKKFKDAKQATRWYDAFLKRQANDEQVDSADKKSDKDFYIE